jgi:short-subunit dehydrogenase
MAKMSNMNNKVVWITGASSGIGEALAYELAQSGATLILSARNEIELERVRAACQFSQRHQVIPLDLENNLDLEAKINAAIEQHGPIDVLINNAGISQRYLVADSSFAVDKKIIDVNLLGAIAMTRPVLKHMLARNQGQIAVVSSMLGLYGIQSRAAYSASKHGLRGYFESLRNELAQTAVRITLVYPGYIGTEITKNAMTADGGHYGGMDKVHAKGIPASVCAKKIIHALEQQKAVVIISGFKERLGAFMNRFFPALFRIIAPKFKI